MQLIVLGCGSSAGTPVIGCHCPTCTSTDPRNQRTRSSAAFVMPGGEVILVDSGPDIRQQSLRENLQRVDAVLYTHTHADHVHGIDDLRSFCQLQRQQIPLYGSPDTMATITLRFNYAFLNAVGDWDLPILSVNPVSDPFEACGVTITPVPVLHGRDIIYGYRIGTMAYLTDVSDIPKTSLELLHGLDMLLLDCLRYKPHYTHINLEQSIEYAELIGARKTYLIHMTHELEYNELSSKLPESIHVAYDGLRLDDNQVT